MNSSSLACRPCACSASVPMSHVRFSSVLRARCALPCQRFVGRARLQAFDGLRHPSHPHRHVEPVEDRFAELSELPLRLPYRVVAIAEKCRGPRREHTEVVPLSTIAIASSCTGIDQKFEPAIQSPGKRESAVAPARRVAILDEFVARERLRYAGHLPQRHSTYGSRRGGSAL
jgi:hypothetical protein